MKKYGWLIFNGNFINDKLAELYQFYKNTAFELSINLELVKNNDIFSIIEDGKIFIKTRDNLKEPDFILFLDKDINLARTFESCGYRVFNSADVLEICDDKILSYRYIAEKSELKLPKTLVSPFIFNICEEIKTEREKLISFVESEFCYPFVIKEAKGSFGEQVYLVRNRGEFFSIKEKIGARAHLYQEFIKSSFGKDIRIYVVGQKFVAGMMRYSSEDFRSNVNLGGGVKKVDIEPEFVEMAVEISKILKSDFIGVDILFGEFGEPIFCEVNSNSYVKNVSELTGVNVCEEIFKHILAEI